MAPAIHTARVELVTMLKQTAVASSGRLSHFRSGKALVALQVALSLLLLIGAGLFLRTLFNLKGQAFGFQPDNLLVFRMNPFLSGYDGEKLMNFYEDALTQIQSLPGVQSASISRWGILMMASSGGGVCIPGSEPANVATHPIAPKYFETMRIPLLVGRDIDWRDRENMARVAVVNEAFVKKFYGEKNPVGESFQFGCSREQKGFTTEIVGVAGNTKYFAIRDSVVPAVYFPYRQGTERWMTFAVRTAAEDPTELVPAVRNVLAGMDPNLPIYDVAAQREWIDLNVMQEERYARLLVVFGAIAVLLACSGIYGTLAYLVNRRTSEIGIRMAIGARRYDVVGMILRESLIPVVVGIGLGLAGAFGLTFGLTRFVDSMLFGVQPTDPLTMIAAVAFLLFTAVLAALLPARRASRIDPMIALRCE
jgi:predicted permease